MCEHQRAQTDQKAACGLKLRNNIVPSFHHLNMAAGCEDLERGERNRDLNREGCSVSCDVHSHMWSAWEP